jgi:hypothetical protein
MTVFFHRGGLKGDWLEMVVPTKECPAANLLLFGREGRPGRKGSFCTVVDWCTQMHHQSL